MHTVDIKKDIFDMVGNSIRIIVLIGLFFVSIKLPAADLCLTMRKMYISSAETQTTVERLDSLVRQLEVYMTQQVNYSFIPIDSVQTTLQRVVLDDFYLSIDPDLLMPYKNERGLDAILFVYLEKQNKTFQCRIKAVEFPSGLPIEDLVLPLSKGSELGGASSEVFDPFLMTISHRKTTFGFPFKENDTGIVIVTDKLEPVFFKPALLALRLLQKQDDMYENFRVKPLYLRTNHLPLNELGNSIVKQSNAAAILCYVGQQLPFILLPADRVEKSVLKNTLPIWPPYDGFKSFHVMADSAYVLNFARCFYPTVNDHIDSVARNPHILQSDLPSVLVLLRSMTRTSLSSDRSRYNDTLRTLFEIVCNAFQRSDHERAWAQANYAAFLDELQDYEKAMTQLQQAYDGFRFFDNQFAQLLILVHQARIHFALLEYDQAVKQYNRALDFARELNDSHALAVINYQLGSLALQQNQFVGAWDYFKFSADHYQEIGDTLRVVQLYTKLGVLMRQSNILRRSQEYLQDALEIASAIDADQETADASYQLAATLIEMGEMRAAKTHFETAGDWYEILSDTLNIAHVEEHIGDVQSDLGQRTEALFGYLYSARFYSYTDAIDDVIRTTIKAADIAVEEKKWQRAQRLYDKALTTAKDRNKREWAGIILYKKGAAHVQQGLYVQGQKEIEMARLTTLTEEDIERFMKSEIRELEYELEQYMRSDNP